jgi:hypothetical protein
VIRLVRKAFIGFPKQTALGRFHCWTLLRSAQEKTPRSTQEQGVRRPPPGPKPPAHDHMWSIITWPKPEHDTWVAPSIRRAKSYVTF